MKIICVDDERLLMECTVSRCRELGMVDEVNGFVRPDEALGYIENNTVDIALLDIEMPGMNGIELAARIKSASPDTAIVFLTGY